jgi:hypothetical protein
MTLPRSAIERRIGVALESSPARIPVIVGGCGTGRTTLLRALERQPALAPCLYLDVERSATTPERFLRALTGSAQWVWKDAARPLATARDAFDAALSFFGSAVGPRGEPVTFLLDEILEMRTFESFPGLRSAMPDLLGALAGSRNRFVLATRFTARALRLLRDDSMPALMLPLPALNEDEVREALDADFAPARLGHGDHPSESAELAPLVHALTGGRPLYIRAMADTMATMRQYGGDPLSALTALFAPDGRLTARCGRSYELRLNRARGYGALKAILEILAEVEPLTLTEISLRLGRTPGSTKDYLSWLEDVDLVGVDRKRYTFADPLLRLWVRLNCRPAPPTGEDVAREVQCYAVARLAQPPAVDRLSAARTPAATREPDGVAVPASRLKA